MSVKNGNTVEFTISDHHHLIIGVPSRSLVVRRHLHPLRHIAHHPSRRPGAPLQRLLKRVDDLLLVGALHSVGFAKNSEKNQKMKNEWGTLAMTMTKLTRKVAESPGANADTLRIH